MLVHALDDGTVRFTSAMTAQEGLSCAQRQSFDLILLDLGLPDLGGFEVVRQLKLDTRTKLVPVILLTAQDSTEDKVRGFENGAVDYITKPFELAELRARVRAQLRTQLLQRQLVEARKLESLGHLAAGIAHEINTPIQFVGDNLAFLREAFEGLAASIGVPCKESVPSTEPSGPTELQYFLGEIPKAIHQSLEGLDRVAKIVQSMREFSYPNALRKEPADLNRAIESAVVVARHEWKSVAELKLELVPDLPPLVCAAGQITQVLLNLLVNAAHAIADSPRVAHGGKGLIGIRSRVEAEHVIIEVEDNGVGIPVQVRNKIFDPFTTTKEVGRGTGQGLYIVHQAVVEGHGGEIMFQTDLGVGTTFIIRLPLRVAGEDAA